MQFIVENFILTVFAAAVETVELNREDMNVQQSMIPQTRVAEIVLTLSHTE